MPDSEFFQVSNSLFFL